MSQAEKYDRLCDLLARQLDPEAFRMAEESPTLARTMRSRIGLAYRQAERVIGLAVILKAAAEHPEIHILAATPPALSADAPPPPVPEKRGLRLLPRFREAMN